MPVQFGEFPASHDWKKKPPRRVLGKMLPCGSWRATSRRCLEKPGSLMGDNLLQTNTRGDHVAVFTVHLNVLLTGSIVLAYYLVLVMKVDSLRSWSKGRAVSSVASEIKVLKLKDHSMVNPTDVPWWNCCCPCSEWLCHVVIFEHTIVYIVLEDGKTLSYIYM